MEDELIFKSYSRLLLRDLKDVKEALMVKDYETAEKFLNELINDTQKDVESGN
ncbi:MULTISPECIES: hypothetical protein [Bacillaceae]|uniref:hypothetical protein n=1 Tax=Bacillaceae TaxID=186817 RepID=UPI001584CC52|nr:MULTISPECIES: hypothetical protein [Bacillaceae]